MSFVFVINIALHALVLLLERLEQVFKSVLRNYVRTRIPGLGSQSVQAGPLKQQIS